MAIRSRPSFAEEGELGLVVTVVRGHADEAFRVFRAGADALEFTVGAQSDWEVTGPGVVTRHLRLAFHGGQLFAAAGHGTTLLRGQQLANEWSALREGDELRFGFALLRVGGKQPPVRRRSSAPSGRRAWLPWSIAGGALALVGVGGALFALLGNASTTDVTAAASASAAAANTAATPPTPDSALFKRSAEEAGAPTPVPEVVAIDRPPVEPLVPLPLPDEQGASALNQGVSAAPAKPPAAFPQNIADRPVPRVGDKPWLISEEWREHHERLLGAVGRASAKLVFLGDSITEGWWSAPAYKQYFGKYAPLNLGIASDTTRNVLWRLEHGALDGTHPQLVVILVGINNLAGGFSPEETAGGLRAIVASTQRHVPGARILLLAVLPARQDAANPLRQKITDCNKLLLGMAQPGRVEVLDVGSVLLEPDGSIVKTTLRDYLHPTPAGYEKLSRAILPKLEAVLGG